MILDTRFWPLLLELRTCLCDELARSAPEHAQFCSCSVVPGAAVDLSGVVKNKSMAWVRLGNSVPSNSPPTQLVQMQPCFPNFMATVEIGVARCIAIPQASQATLGQTVLENATELQMSDMAAMVRAVCCLGRDHLLGTYTPGGPEGGVLWGTWTVYFPQED